jgi:hypothetical protein
MVPIQKFVGTLAVPGKSFKDIQKTVRDAYGDKAIKTTQIYDILKKVKKGSRLWISDILIQRERRECRHLSPMSPWTWRMTGE